MTDPIELIVENALIAAGIEYHRDGDGMTSGLDFRVEGTNVHIECKQFHSDRITEQTARVDNVIVVQGREAAEWLLEMLARGKR